MNNASTETHPLPPFLPAGARLLMLGSFPPQQKRWSMDFYYPNFNNDMWRVMAYIYYDNPLYFVDSVHKRFVKQDIVDFLNRTGIALHDAAQQVIRLNNNASDKDLHIVKATELQLLLSQLPHCHAVATTGQKATTTICEQLGITPPPVSGCRTLTYLGRELRLYRMPSTSRAYPMSIQRKAEAYRTMLQQEGLFSTSLDGAAR